MFYFQKVVKKYTFLFLLWCRFCFRIWHRKNDENVIIIFPFPPRGEWDHQCVSSKQFGLLPPPLPPSMSWIRDAISPCSPFFTTSSLLAVLFRVFLRVPMSVLSSIFGTVKMMKTYPCLINSRHRVNALLKWTPSIDASKFNREYSTFPNQDC